ncbi:MAG: hypothetical protein PHW12_02640 [Smithella sp.]|nr:hypothetical protein [Smithella sp.]MDD5674365.1 hypothetical protein [Chitinivibrionales bacterium]
MKETNSAAEFNALICEAQVIGIEVDAMKVANREAELKNEYPSPYNFEDFMELAFKVGEIADKFRKLGGTK